ncbi:MAG: 6-bladed beta-propeller, partial [Nitrososphaeraceae archaeon]
MSKAESFSLFVLVFSGTLALLSGLVVINNFSIAETDNNMSSNVTVQTNSPFVNKWGSSCLLNTHYGCSDTDGPSGPLSLGDGQFSSIWGVAAESGKVYVLDVGNNRIQVFSDNGTFIKFIKTWGSFCDITTSNKCTDPDGPSGPLSLGDGQFNYPQGISTDSIGNIFVSDSGNNRIQVFSDNGTFIKTWGSIGSGPGQFRHPEGITVDKSGNNNIVYVADSGNNRIQVFSDNGTFIKTWGSFCQISPNNISSQTCSDPDGTQGPMELGDGQFSHPTSIAVDSGQIFVADNLNDRVQVFSSPSLLLRSTQPLNVLGTANNTAPAPLAAANNTAPAPLAAANNTAPAPLAAANNTAPAPLAAA